jgi:hypothetical protein
LKKRHGENGEKLKGGKVKRWKDGKAENEKSGINV